MTPSFAHTDDLTTWRSMRQGDRAAFEFIYRQYVQILFRYGYSFSEDETTVMDLIHDLFSDLWQKRARLGDTDSIKFYLLRSLKNRLIRHSKVSKRQLVSRPESFLDLISSHAESRDDESILTALHQQLDLHLSELSPRQQEIIRLKFYEDLSHQQIAELLGMNPQSAKNLLHRAIEALRRHFDVGTTLLVLYLLKFL